MLGGGVRFVVVSRFFFFGLKFIKPVIITIIRDKDREK